MTAPAGVTPDDDDWLVDHQVLVETYLGETSDGATWSVPAARAVGLEEKTELARDSNGDEVTIGGRIFASLALLEFFTPETRVQIRPGRTARVVAVEVFAAGGELAELDHIEALFV